MRDRDKEIKKQRRFLSVTTHLELSIEIIRIKKKKTHRLRSVFQGRILREPGTVGALQERVKKRKCQADTSGF